MARQQRSELLSRASKRLRKRMYNERHLAITERSFREWVESSLYPNAFTYVKNRDAYDSYLEWFAGKDILNVGTPLGIVNWSTRMRVQWPNITRQSDGVRYLGLCLQPAFHGQKPITIVPELATLTMPEIPPEWEEKPLQLEKPETRRHAEKPEDIPALLGQPKPFQYPEGYKKFDLAETLARGPVDKDDPII
jgi:hypothetical protein